MILIGPRQCGKTTLAQSFSSEYFDLQKKADQLDLDLRWDELVACKKLMVLDEAQAFPHIFKRLRGAIDKDRKRNGRFLLLSSVSPSLIKPSSESLAGRVAILNLAPFSFMEVVPKYASDKRLWLAGGFPDGGVLKPSQFFHWQESYLHSLVQRDLIDWGMPAKAPTTLKLMKMLAHTHGTPWNSSKIANSLGLTHKTVNSYLDYLEGAFLIRRLPPFYANTKKRLIKSPKVYIRDSGLLHQLLNLKSLKELLSHPQAGASWEGFVIEQILTTLDFCKPSYEAFFFQTSDKHELDLVLDFGSQKRWAIEIKLTSSPSQHQARILKKTASLSGISKKFLISQSKRTIAVNDFTSCNLSWFLKKRILPLK